MDRKPRCSKMPERSKGLTSITPIIQTEAQTRAYLMIFKLNKNIRVKSESLMATSITKAETESDGKRWRINEFPKISLNSSGAVQAAIAFAKKTIAKPKRKIVNGFLNDIFACPVVNRRFYYQGLLMLMFCYLKYIKKHYVSKSQNHSYRKASIGLSLDALFAGYIPKPKPNSADTPTARSTP